MHGGALCLIFCTFFSGDFLKIFEGTDYRVQLNVYFFMGKTDNPSNACIIFKNNLESN